MSLDSHYEIADVVVNEAHSPAAALRCTRCGGSITARLVYTGHSYSEHRDLDGYECDDYTCGAEWDAQGDSVTP